jgi:4-oxalocrotonate tautomerase family enzyme
MITVSGPATDVAHKRKLVEGLTKTAAEVFGLPADTIVVIIQENPPENVARGGVLLTDRQPRS